jgi:phosphoheptose isomerase
MLTDRIKEHFTESIQTKIIAADEMTEVITSAANKIVKCFLSDHKLLICGNGGSAADSQHFSAELLNRFETERPPLPAIALTTDASTLTSIGNDYDFSEVFSKQIRALGHTGDILFVISTSGNSSNILKAIDAAHQRNMTIIALTGREGGKITDKLSSQDLQVCVPNSASRRTCRIQEIHILIIHILCDLIDHQIFGESHP